MFELQLHFERNIERKQEKNDEGQLQIVGLTIEDGTVMTHVQNIDLMQQRPFNYFRSWPNHRGTFQNPVKIATINRSNPYFGYVIRAIELDNSSQRQADLERYIESIRQTAQLVVDGGGLPTVDAIWLGGNAPGLNDDIFKDDDDKIGVSARVYRNYGLELARPNRVIDPPVAGALIPGTTKYTQLLFRGSGASWRLNVYLEAIWT
ncbi:hypothetical protein LCGC14_0670960 [marine sediment metagenome]|uniref:Uncharacterized protein n=2 Tax=root TaxID=1 RepID=A0A831QUX8_9FLAO|nr:hypothetical protein [Pricia antarctica]